MSWARKGSALALVVVMALALSPDASRGADGDALALVRGMFNQARISFFAKMKLSAPGGLVREIEVSHAQNGHGSMTYMEITSPYILKGTRFLSFDNDNAADEHFTYVPAVRRSVEVPQWTLEQPFLGSNFYMIDITEPKMDKFSYRSVGEGEVSGRSCRKVESIPSDSEYPYGRIVYCIDPNIWMSVFTEFYDRQGQLLKVWKPTRLEQVDGVWTPLHQTMEDVQTNTSSEFEVLEIHQHAQFPEQIFTKAYLDR
ncbi:MAG: outer membrane lipoprotein-sorting protein [Deltaproteobacteria bacterium]|nr:outer membrane lipoprotein-sorting protein [Deltaproteobacteria bacterium]